MKESPQWLAVMRVALSATLFCSVYWWTGNIGDRLSWHGQFRGSYWLLEWLGVSPAMLGCNALFCVALKASALFMCVGLFYRLSSLLFLTCFAYTFALDASRYSHESYLVLLCAALLAAMPANRMWSFDAYIARNGGWCWLVAKSPAIDCWHRRTVRWLVAIVCFYSALSKLLRFDFVARGEPLADSVHFQQFVAPLRAVDVDVDLAARCCARALVAAELVVAAAIVSVDGAARVLVFALSFLVQLFYRCLAAPSMMQPLLVALSSACLSPQWLWPSVALMCRRRRPRRRHYVAYWAITFIACQALVPLHRFAYTGDTAHHEYGRWFSWHSDLAVDKRCTMEVLVHDATLPEHHNSFAPRWLNATNPGHWQRVARNPTLISQYALYLAREWRDAPPDMVTHDSEHAWPQVSVQSQCSINGREPRALVSPNTDMAAINRSGASFEWPHIWLSAD
jgi:HTTM domain/Vitamin K-dependent gamma-carboxylase, lumenal domain